MAEADEGSSEKLASQTLALLGRVEKRLEKMWEILLRHDTRLGRIERDLNDVKSDVVLLENRTLTQANEILGFVSKIDTMDEKLDRLLARAESNHS